MVKVFPAMVRGPERGWRLLLGATVKETVPLSAPLAPELMVS